jgi:hypothetical protein
MFRIKRLFLKPAIKLLTDKLVGGGPGKQQAHLRKFLGFFKVSILLFQLQVASHVFECVPELVNPPA